MRDKWLELKNVEAWIGDKRIFYDLNLVLDIGQNTVVLGPNGSGKSTLIKLISREIYPIVKPDSEIKIFGERN